MRACAFLIFLHLANCLSYRKMSHNNDILYLHYNSVKSKFIRALMLHYILLMMWVIALKLRKFRVSSKCARCSFAQQCSLFETSCVRLNSKQCCSHFTKGKKWKVLSTRRPVAVTRSHWHEQMAADSDKPRPVILALRLSSVLFWKRVTCLSEGQKVNNIQRIRKVCDPKMLRGVTYAAFTL